MTQFENASKTDRRFDTGCCCARRLSHRKICTASPDPLLCAREEIEKDYGVGLSLCSVVATCDREAAAHNPAHLQ